MEVKNGFGTIENKEEAMSKKGKYWRYKIRMDGQEDAKYPTSFSMWEYEAGSKVNVGDHVEVFWEENPGKNAVGKEVTYRNIKSIGKGQTDPNLGSDEQLSNEAPKESMKDVIQKENGDKGICQSPYDRKLEIDARGKAIYYATQLASVYFSWALKEGKKEWTLDDMEGRVKELAKGYEEQIMRKEK